jgi:hypothetical protein
MRAVSPSSVAVGMHAVGLRLVVYPRAGHGCCDIRHPLPATRYPLPAEDATPRPAAGWGGRGGARRQGRLPKTGECATRRATRQPGTACRQKVLRHAGRGWNGAAGTRAAAGTARGAVPQHGRGPGPRHPEPARGPERPPKTGECATRRATRQPGTACRQKVLRHAGRGWNGARGCPAARAGAGPAASGTRSRARTAPENRRMCNTPGYTATRDGVSPKSPAARAPPGHRRHRTGTARHGTAGQRWAGRVGGLARQAGPTARLGGAPAGAPAGTRRPPAIVCWHTT